MPASKKNGFQVGRNINWSDNVGSRETEFYRNFTPNLLPYQYIEYLATLQDGTIIKHPVGNLEEVIS
jgi:hypothetical protein